ncbi:hypothetical protein evm_002615 [Chilo suppressalis]|nr:hypothetical protein evm_002615 [Chilo suppressalis]
MSLFYHPFLFVLLEFFLDCEVSEVDAVSSEIVALPGWFNSVEKYVSRNVKSKSDVPRLIVDTQDGDAKIRQRNSRKRRRKIVRKVVNTFKNGMPIKEAQHKKKKRKRKRFEKATSDIDSNLSNSQEKTASVSKKPVDIIVHIKMSD